MPELLLYLLKVNVALVLFYMAYHIALRRLTFYHLNRLFLVFGIVFSTVYPFIDLSEILRQQTALPNHFIPAAPVWFTTTNIPEPTPAFDYWQFPLLLFWVGTTVMVARFLLQFISLYKIHAASVPTEHKGIGFRQVDGITQAFSFWQAIYLNPTQHKREELESVLRHEQVHVKNWHTLDVLLAELSTACYWFNPSVWLIRKAIKENLEFIADQNVLRAGVNQKEYQYLLLKVTGAPEPQIANLFSFPSLKRRITMMNKNPTKKLNQLRLLVVLPIVAGLLFAFRGTDQGMRQADKGTPNEMKERSQQAVQQDGQQELPDDYKAFLKRNPTVEHIRWQFNDNKKAVVIHLKSGDSETYDLNDSASQAELNRKYGELPALPLPPPPPVLPDPLYIPDASNQQADYKAFLERNPTVKQVGWTGNQMSEVVIFLKSGDFEIFDMSDSRSVAAAESRYGKLPTLPPPPPPVRKDQK